MVAVGHQMGNTRDLGGLLIETGVDGVRHGETATHDVCHPYANPQYELCWAALCLPWT